MGNPVVHFEVISANGSGAQSFYEQMFGWNVNSDNPINYGAVDTGSGSEALKGGISSAYPGTDENYVTFYIGVDSVAEMLAKVVEAGGKIAMPEMALPGGAKMAQFFDPFGARIGLLEQAPAA